MQNVGISDSDEFSTQPGQKSPENGHEKCHLLALNQQMHGFYDQTRRDTTALINMKLSAEILCEVFCHVKALSYSNNPGAPGRGVGPVNWIQPVTHVCGYWRSIALSNPCLWTDGFPVNVTGLETFLERSQDLPLIFDSDVTERMWPSLDSVALVFSHIERAKVLRIKILDHPIITELFTEAMSDDMPYLNILDISIISAEAAPLTPISLPQFDNFRSIEDLKLSHCSFTFKEGVLRDMTTLSLKDVGQRISVVQISDVLRDSPRLQTLELSHVTYDDKDDQGFAPKQLTLPILESLLIESTGTSLAKVLMSADLPKVRDITLHVSTSHQATMLWLLNTGARLLSYQLPRTITITDAEYYPDRKTFTYSQLTSNTQSFHFTNSWNFVPSIDLALAVLLCMKEFDLKFLEGFQSNLRQPLSRQWWMDALGTAKSLNFLAIDNVAFPGGFLSALTPDVSVVRSGRKKSGVMLPSLRFLSMDNVDFTPVPPHVSRSRTSRQDGSLMHLEYCMKRRMECGFKQYQLAVETTFTDLRRGGANLQKYVESFVCSDGIVQSSDDESDEDMNINVKEDLEDFVRSMMGSETPWP